MPNNDDDSPLPAHSKTAAASASQAAATAPKPKASTPAKPGGSVDETLVQLKQRMSQNQRGIDELRDEARRTREANDLKFDGLQSTLQTILATLSAGAASASAATQSTSTATNVVEPPLQPTSPSSVDVQSEFGGFSAANRAASVMSLPSGSVASTDSAPLARQAPRKLHSLPKFSGDPEKWPKFYMRLKQTTEAYGYSAIDNSLRLQDCLEGEALDAVDEMLNDGSNTDDVIAELESRFGRPELLAEIQLKHVREVQPIPETRPELIIPFSSRVTNMLKQIDQPKTRKYLDNPELLSQLVEKLPISRRHAWGDFAVTVVEPSIHHFAAWLKDQTKRVALMTSASKVAAATLSAPSTSAVRPRQSAVPQRRDRVTHVSTNSGRKCGVCLNSNHETTNCREFGDMSVDNRWDCAREKHLCFSCLRHGHGLMSCNSKKSCGIDGCTRPHNQLLHPTTTTSTSSENPPSRNARRNPFGQRSSNSNSDATRQPPTAVTQSDSARDDTRERCNASQQPAASIFYRIVPVQLHGVHRTVHTYAFLDDGSSVSLLDGALADELGLDGPESTLDLHWFGGQCATETSRMVKLRISGGNNGSKYDLTNVRTVRKLDLPIQTIRMSDMCRRYECLRGLPVDSYREAVPKLLIGLDNVHLMVATRQVTCEEPGPVATRTKLGWVVCGPTRPTPSTSVVLHMQSDSISTQMDEIDMLVRAYFGLENFGVRHVAAEMESRVDKRARQIMQKTTTHIGGRYETGLLWRDDSVQFPPSREMAVRRLMTVERRMKRDAAFAKEYKEIMDGYVSKGYARRLTVSEAAQEDQRTWYLPHFGVININKPGKLRIVFDAAAMTSGVSLNSMLLKGPDLNRPMLAVLHAFRMGAVGVTADIREMFPQIRIRACDTDAQRYLWRGGDDSQPIETYVMQALIFGAACSPCCAQYVKNVNADRFVEENPDAVRLIHDAHYVDDFVAGFDTEDEAARLTTEVVAIHKQGGFELRGFRSNSLAVLRAIGESAPGDTAVDMELEKTADKVLGMYWCTTTDSFLFRLAFNRVDKSVMDGSRRPTKREMLSTVMSIFDPFGVLANFVIYAKLMLQDLWRHGTSWDEAIPADIAIKWTQWLASLDECRRVRIPRCYGAMLAQRRVQLHIFADASQTAFATVAYWRVEEAPSQWRVVFITGKSRCAPPKLISIPRLELQAAILAVRIMRSIRTLHDIPVERTYFWTDSKTVVQWIRADHLQFRPFVAHRIAEIHEETTIAQWRWVPTMQNVADDATRAKYPVRFEAQNRWISGPDFLLREEKEWPQEPAQTPCVDGAEEVKTSSAQMVCSINSHSIMQVTRFGDFRRACRSMAYVLRFIHNTRTAKTTRRFGELLPVEMEEAERRLIIEAQADAFTAEMDSLKRDKRVDKKSSIHKLLPHIDEQGLLRVTGRTEKAAHMPRDMKNPIILPRKHLLSTLVVSMVHRKLRHQQAATVVCEVRCRFWIPHLPALVRQVKADCMLCRIKSARALAPIMGQLPIDRLTPFVRPFTYAGVDYFGPVLVTIGRRREKRWVALFTCLTVRAVHLELAADLSTDSFILCLRNFINLRGVPKQIRSDNGTNFVGASRELKEAVDMLDHESIQRELGVQNIRWLFNCPGDPEAGGCWERLVQSVKRILAVSLKEIAPQVETLRSLLIEAANIVNSRPLTHLPLDCEDDEPLTPNHLLLGATSSTQTPGPVDDRPICMRKQWRIAQALKDRFWKRWLLEYLPDLTRRAKGYVDPPNLQIGSLVLVVDPLLARGQWRRGRISDVCLGPDGKVRTATVRTSDGELRRPVSKLAVLDVGKSAAPAV